MSKIIKRKCYVHRKVASRCNTNLFHPKSLMYGFILNLYNRHVRSGPVAVVFNSEQSTTMALEDCPYFVCLPQYTSGRFRGVFTGYGRGQEVSSASRYQIWMFENYLSSSCTMAINIRRLVSIS